MVDGLIGRPTWWVVPLLALWALAAFGIGVVWRRSAWVAGPVAIGVAAPAIMGVFVILSFGDPGGESYGYSLLALRSRRSSPSRIRAIWGRRLARDHRRRRNHHAAMRPGAIAAAAVRHCLP